MKKYTVYVSGMHCASCEILIERALKKEGEITHPKVSLATSLLTFESEKSDIQGMIASLNSKLSPLGYSISQTKENKAVNTEILWTAIPIGLAFLLGFFILQTSGVLSFGLGSHVSPVTSFLIGLVASVSSCLAVVGGLVLSLSAKVSQDDSQKSKSSIVLFHTGRIIGFTLLGGVLGLLGQSLGVSFTFSALLGMVSAIFMIILGLNLMGIIKKNTVTLPKGIFAIFAKGEKSRFAPILIGLGTFFLPCGFTQSMQIAALASGSFYSGSLIMLAFAFGTFPVLALLSFGSISFAQSKHAPLFFATAGVVVIGLGIFAFLAGIAGLGIIRPLFNI